MSINRGRHFVSVTFKHRIAAPPSPAQYCTHALIVRWAGGWRGIAWQVER